MELKRTNLNDKITDTINDFNDNWANIEGSLELKADKQQEAWITPTLLNGWYAIRPNEPPQYMKDTLGFVHFRGAIAKSAESASNIAFTMPIGYRPDIQTLFNVVEIGGTGFRSLAAPVFPGTGNVDFAGAKPGTISWYVLDNTFKAVK